MTCEPRYGNDSRLIAYRAIRATEGFRCIGIFVANVGNDISEVFVSRLKDCDRYLQKGMGLMALTGRRPAEIFFSASFSLPKKKLSFPAVIFDGQLKTRQAPGSFEPYPIPVLADPKKLIQALDRLRTLKSFPSPDAVNTTPARNSKYVSAAFGSI